MNFTHQPLRDLARGAPCMFKVPGICNNDPETSVWCHSNELRHGKGKAIKAHDCFGAIGCSACHAWHDQGRASRADKIEAFYRAFEGTLLWLWWTGKIAVIGSTGAARALRAKVQQHQAKGRTHRPSKILPHSGAF